MATSKVQVFFLVLLSFHAACSLSYCSCSIVHAVSNCNQTSLQAHNTRRNKSNVTEHGTLRRVLVSSYYGDVSLMVFFSCH